MKTFASSLVRCLAGCSVLFALACSVSQDLGNNDARGGMSDGGRLDGGSVMPGDGDGDDSHVGDASVPVGDGGDIPVGMGNGTVVFRWTFQGGAENCAQASVEQVSLNFAEQYLILPCRTAAGQSTRITGVMAGMQSYEISAFAGSGSTFVQVRGDVNVIDGKETVVDVALQLTDGGAVDFKWTFDHGKTCAQVGASDVQATIGGRTHTFPCKLADGEHGVMTGIYPGQPNFTLLGLKAGKIIAKTGGKVAITQDMTAAFPVDIPLVDATNTGRLALDWYMNKNNAYTCHEQQSALIGLVVGDFAPLALPCLDPSRSGYRGAILDFLPPGDISIQAGDGAAQTFTVVAGEETKATVTVGDGQNLSSGDVVFVAKFAGKTCEEAGVTQVHVSLSGFTEDTDEQVPCGATLVPQMITVYGGDLHYTLTATGSGGTQYSAKGGYSSYYGAHPIHVDLQNTWSDTGTGTVSADFRFGPRGDTCGVLGIDKVHLFVSDFADKFVAGSEKTVACADLPVALTLPAGSYDVNVEGLRKGQREYFDEFLNVGVSGNGKHDVVMAVGAR